MSSKGVGQKRLFQVSELKSDSNSDKENKSRSSEKDDENCGVNKRLKLDSSGSDDGSEHPLKHMLDEPG